MSGAGKEVPGGDTGAAEEVVEDIGIPEAKLKPANDDIEFYEAKEVKVEDFENEPVASKSEAPARVPSDTITDETQDTSVDRAPSKDAHVVFEKVAVVEGKEEAGKSNKAVVVHKKSEREHGHEKVLQEKDESDKAEHRAHVGGRSSGDGTSSDKHHAHIRERRGSGSSGRRSSGSPKSRRSASPVEREVVEEAEEEPLALLPLSQHVCASCLALDANLAQEGATCAACGVQRSEQQVPLDFSLSADVMQAINSLRVQLGLACRQRGTPDGGAMLENTLHECDKEARGLISLLEFVRCMGRLDVHVRKRDFRPLRDDVRLCTEEGHVRYAAVAFLINSARWWPRRREIEMGMQNSTRLCAELDALLGPRMGRAVSQGQSTERLREILAFAKAHPYALEELKDFLSMVPFEMKKEGSLDVEEVHAHVEQDNNTKTLKRSNKQSVAQRAGTPYAKPSPFPALRPASVLSPEHSDSPERTRVSSPPSLFQALKLPKKNKPFVDPVYAPPPAPIQEWPYQRLPKHLAKPDFVWKTWVDRSGKEHAPQKIRRDELGSCRRRAMEFSKNLEVVNSPVRQAKCEAASKLWRRAKFPSHAIEYIRWQTFSDTYIPGFSTQKSSSSPKDTVRQENRSVWQGRVMRRPLKVGSRHTEPIGDGPEPQPEELTTTSQLMSTLRNEREKSNVALEATDLLKTVRLCVLKGMYDKALQDTQRVVEKYKAAGKYGEALLHELGDPEHHVIELLKHEIDKIGKVARDALARGIYDKALAQIPTLRDACLWLRRCGVTYPEAREPTHWEVRKGVTGKDFPEGMAVMDLLTDDIIEAQQQQYIVHEMGSLVAIFSAVKPVVDLSVTDTIRTLQADVDKHNKLPSEVVADGRTYCFVMDVKPPELPAELELGTQIMVKGERVLGSGIHDDGTTFKPGTIASWNNRASKYKVQYLDDYEWMLWPTHLQVEIITQPEDVAIEASGFTVRTVTYQHGLLGDKAVLVAFAVVPAGPPFDLSKFSHNVPFTVIGVRSGNVLLTEEDSTDPASAQRTQSQETATDSSKKVKIASFRDQQSEALSSTKSQRKGTISVNVLPPELLRPGKRYYVRDAVTNEILPGGNVTFTSQDKSVVKVFAAGDDIELPSEGVYNICASGGGKEGCPWSLQHMVAVAYQGLYTSERHLVMSKHVLRSDELRAVVTWGETPTEIDTHVHTSYGDHINWRNGGNWINGVRLDMDVMTGHGPETVTFRIKETLSYSLSLECVGDGDASWDISGAKVSLYDQTGLICVVKAPHPHGKHRAKQKWWHVIALDGSQWNKNSKGLVKVNQLSESGLPQLAVPGWTLLEAARRGHWDDLHEQVKLVGSGKASELAALTGQPSIMPMRLARVASAQGETLLGLLSRHDEGEGEDPAVGDERGEKPVNKQMRALLTLLKYTIELEKRARSPTSQDGGLPTLETWMREVSIQGPQNSIFFSLATRASVNVAVHMMRVIVPICKRLASTSPLRLFYMTHGEELLLQCAERRHHTVIVPVLQALLDIDAVWERRAKRQLRTNDFVQIEMIPGSGEWRDGRLFQKTDTSYQVALLSDPGPKAKHSSAQYDKDQDKSSGTPVSPLASPKRPRTAPPRDWVGGKVPPNDSDLVKDLPPSRIKWRSRAMETLKAMYQNWQQQVKHIEFSGKLSAQHKEVLQAEQTYKYALSLVQEKAYMNLYAS